MKRRLVRGMEPPALLTFPAWELIESHPPCDMRIWHARFLNAGGIFYGGRMIAFKADPVWRRLELRQGEGVSLIAIDRDEIIELQVLGPAGEGLDEMLKDVPRPSLEACGLTPESLKDLLAKVKVLRANRTHPRLTSREILEGTLARSKAVREKLDEEKNGRLTFSERLAEELRRSEARRED